MSRTASYSTAEKSTQKVASPSTPAPMTSRVCCPVAGASGSQRRAITITATPIGMLMKKTSRQPKSSPPNAMTRPPTTGPSAVPSATTVPITPKARPRSRPWNICWTRPDTWGLISPPDSPCRTRATIRISGLGAMPDKALVTTKPATPTMNISRRPWSSPSRPASTGTRPKASV